MPTDTQDLAQAVARMNRRLRQERHSELTPSQLSLLGTVRTKGPLTPGALAAAEGVQPPTITRAVNHLVESGLVDRAPHPGDGRQVLLTLSDSGDRVLAQERRRRDAWLQERLGELAPGERATLKEAAALLERLATR